MKKFFGLEHTVLYINDSGRLILDWIWCGMCSSLASGMVILTTFVVIKYCLDSITGILFHFYLSFNPLWFFEGQLDILYTNFSFESSYIIQMSWVLSQLFTLKMIFLNVQNIHPCLKSDYNVSLHFRSHSVCRSLLAALRLTLPSLAMTQKLNSSSRWACCKFYIYVRNYKLA